MTSSILSVFTVALPCVDAWARCGCAIENQLSRDAPLGLSQDSALASFVGIQMVPGQTAR